MVAPGEKTARRREKHYNNVVHDMRVRVDRGVLLYPKQNTKSVGTAVCLKSKTLTFLKKAQLSIKRQFFQLIIITNNTFKIEIRT